MRKEPVKDKGWYNRIARLPKKLEQSYYNNDEPTGSVIDNAGKLRKQESKEGIKTAGNTRQTKADHTKPKAAAVVT